MSHAVAVMPRVQKELARLPPGIYEAVRDTIRALGENPRPSGYTKLTGREGWRIRVGSYRIIYEIDDGERDVTVLHVGHRREVYR